MTKNQEYSFFDVKEIENLNEEEIKDIFKEYDKFNQTVYDFVIQYYKYIYSKKDYGTGDKLKMIEAHIVSDIADNPGISANSLAIKWDRTPAFISKTLKTLEDKGYIKQTTNEENRRFNIISLTKKGVDLDMAHKKFDIESISFTNKILMEQFSLKEIMRFRKFLEEYGGLINKEMQG